MINIIVCDDNKEINKHICDIINKTMMPIDADYVIKRHYLYDEKFLKDMKEEGPKIYVLDIEVQNTSGLDIAHIIRKTDLDSPIIVVSAHDELADRAFRERLLILDFVSKFYNLEVELKKDIELAMRTFNGRRTLKFNSNRVSYMINLNDINYIAKAVGERKVIIKTISKEYLINKNFIELQNIVSDNFIQTHRSCMVNIDNVKEIDSSNNIIRFENGDETNLLSKSYKLKGRLKDYVNN